MWKKVVLLGVALTVPLSLDAKVGQSKFEAEPECCLENGLSVAFEAAELNPCPEDGEILLAALQEDGESQPERGRRPVNPEEAAKWRQQREQREQNIQMLQVWKLMRDVELRDDQVERFFPLIRQFQKQERELADLRHSISRSIRSELRKDNPDKAELNRLSSELIEISSDIWKVKSDGMKKIMGILDPLQKAKFMLSFSNMERDLWEAIGRMRVIGPGMLPQADFDRENFTRQMEQFHQHIEKIKQELREKGYPLDSGNR